MAALHSRDGEPRIKFGAAEWIGMAALALVPAGGFFSWAIVMAQRVTAVEVRQTDQIDTQKDIVNIQQRQDERLLWLERNDRLRAYQEHGAKERSN